MRCAWHSMRGAFRSRRSRFSTVTAGTSASQRIAENLLQQTDGYSRSACSPLSKLSQSKRSDRRCFAGLAKRTQNRSSRSVFARSSWRRGFPYHRSYDAMLFRAEDRPPRRHRCRRRRRRLSIFRSTERVTRTGPRLLKRRVSRTLWNALHERTTGGRGERRRAGKTRVTKP